MLGDDEPFAQVLYLTAQAYATCETEVPTRDLRSRLRWMQEAS